MPEALSLIRRPAAVGPPTLRDLAAVFFRQRRLVVISFAGIFLAALLYGLIAPSYESQMKVLVQKGRVDPAVSPAPTQSPQFERLEVTEEELNSEVELLRDDEILRSVAQSAGLASRVSFWSRWWHEDEAVRLARAVRGLGQRLRVEPVRKTRLIAVTYASSDPAQSARVLRCLANAYLERHLQLRRPSGESDFFEEQMAEARRGLETAELQLMDFTSAEGVVSAPLQRDLALQKLSDAEAGDQQVRLAIAETRQRVQTLEAKLRLLPEKITTQVRTSDNPQLLEKMKSQLLELRLKRTELLTKFEPTYRLVREVDEQIAETQAALANENLRPLQEQTVEHEPTHEWAKEELVKAQVELSALEARAVASRLLLAKNREAADKLGNHAITQDDLLHKVKAAEEKYLLYANKREEARIGDALDQRGILNVTIAEHPMVPALPTRSGLTYALLGLAVAGTVSTSRRSWRTIWIPHFERRRRSWPTWRLRCWHRCHGEAGESRFKNPANLMSTQAEVLHITAQPDCFEEQGAEQNPSLPRARLECWDWDRFAAEQIQHLVCQVFSPGWPRPAHQVVISAVDRDSDIDGVCMQVGQALAQQVRGSICVVEANLPTAEPENSFGRSTGDPVCGQVRRGSLRESSRQICENLWRMSPQTLPGENGHGPPAAWLRTRLAQLRHDFEYTVLQAPPVLLSSEAALLGSLSDGVILVLEANSTRRIAARRTKELLQAANARVLGTILAERTFPIPERIYRKL
jgi:uncharacterized protein involved in exopolysaccharide biosynthesis